MENNSKPDMIFEFSSLLNKELLSPPPSPKTTDEEITSPSIESRPVSPEEYVIDIDGHMEKNTEENADVDCSVEQSNGANRATLSEDGTEVCAEATSFASYADEGANRATLSEDGTEVCAEANADEGANAEDEPGSKEPYEPGSKEPYEPGSKEPLEADSKEPYEAEPPKCLIMTQNADLIKKSDFFDVLTLDPKPSKWQSVLRYLKSTKVWESYKYLWIVDSNVIFTDDQIYTFFNTISSIKSGIFQPSTVVSAEHPSIHNYPMLLHDQECSMSLKPVKFIENKIPCFTTDIVKESLLPFLTQNEKFLHSGWGIDMWWATKHAKSLYVVNDVQVMNNIPPSLVDKKTGAKEMIHFIRKFKLSVNVLK